MFTQPTTGRQFYGRQRVLDTLDRRVQSLMSGYRHNVALVGDMLCGKSSILLHFMESLKSSLFIPIYVEVMDTSFSRFAEKFMASLLHSYLRTAGEPVTGDWDALMAAGEKHIPRTVDAVRRIRGLCAESSFNLAYRELLELPSLVKDETKKPCIVILDEVHNLEQYRLKDAFLQLGKIIMVQKNTMYIVSSSQKFRIKKILSEKLSLLFGNFEMVEVAGFSTNTARNFIREKLADISIPDYYTEYIMYVTGKRPFYLSVVTDKLKENAKFAAKAKVSADLLKNALSELLFNPTGMLNQHFMNHVHFSFDKGSRKNSLAVLGAMASGAVKMKEISSRSGVSRKDIPAILDELVRSDLVGQCGGFYRISDDLFAFWLRNVYHEAGVRMLDDISERGRRFMGLVDEDIENYLIELNEGIEERVRALFGMFRGEMVEFDGKLRRLPVVTVSSVKKSVIGKNYISLETKGSRWAVAVKKENVEDTDVIDLIVHAAKEGIDAGKMMILALNGIETNALLLAMEKHIWVWDQERVNLLMRLFGKRPLIV